MKKDPASVEAALLGAFRERGQRFIHTGMWRVFHEGSKLTRHNVTDGLWRIRRHMDTDLAKAEAAVAFHQSTKASDPMRLKTDRKRVLTRYVGDGFSCVVKEFVRQPWKPMLADRRSWRSAYGMECYGLPASRYLAWKQTRGGSSYILMEDLGDRNLSDELARAVGLPSPREYSDLLAKAAALVGWMHLAGVYHRDLKTDNFMLVEPEAGEAQLKLIDLDAVSFSGPLGIKRIVRNVQQFMNTLPKTMTSRQALRGAVYYRRMTGVSKNRIRLILSQTVPPDFAACQ